MPDLIQQIFSNVWSAILVVLLFGGSIFVHELGHFLVARRRGLKVDRFSIGFGPKIFGWVRDGVEYRVSWFPLGGYVALPQLADMSGIEGPASEEASKPAVVSYSSKMIVLVMGAVFNVAFALVLGTVVWILGVPMSEQLSSTTVGYVMPEVPLQDESRVRSPAAEAGLREGDRIVAVDGEHLSDWSSLVQALATGTGRDEKGQPRAVLTIERGGQTMDVPVFPRAFYGDGKRKIGVSPAEPLIVEEVLPESPAARAGLRLGDEILSVDGHEFYSGTQLINYVAKNGEKDLSVRFARIQDREFRTTEALQEFIEKAPSADEAFRTNTQTIEVSMRPKAVKIMRNRPAVPSLGIEFFQARRTIHPTPISQITSSISQSYRVIVALIDPRSDVHIGDASGAVEIVRVLSWASRSDVRIAFWFTVMINVSLAIFNLLPIPVLDGGHMLFATIAKLKGQALPSRFVAATQGAFMIAFLTLMLFVGYKNVGRWVSDVSDERRDQQERIAPDFRDTKTP